MKYPVRQWAIKLEDVASDTCILPFCKCPYKEFSEEYGAMCISVAEAPFNSDAGCFKITWKRDFVGRSASGHVPIMVLVEDET